MTNKKYFLLTSAAVLIWACAAQAAPTISSPYVHQGEASVELKSEYKFEDDDDSWGVEVEAGYGVTDFLELAIAVEAEDEGGDEDVEFTELALEGKFQLAQPGTLFIDPGLKLEYKRNLQDGPDSVQAQLLLAKQIGSFSHGSEIGVEREVGEDSEDEFEYNFAYGITYDVSEHFALGAEWYSEFGDFEGDFDEHEHIVGPVAFGEVEGMFEYEAGVLFGVSDAAPDATLKAVIEFEF